MRVTVTGATGFIGTQLIERLTEDGHHVTAVVRQPSAIPSLRIKGVAAIVGDVCDAESLSPAMTGADVVYHLARARAHGTRPREAFAVNVGGSRNVATAATKAGVGRIVHASSVAVYGSRVGIVNEESVIHPDSAYARSKADAESVMHSICGDRVVIARITSVMGKAARTWRPLTKSAMTGTLRLVGDGSNKHHPADVSDVVDALLLCGLRDGVGGRTYNVAGPDSLTFTRLRELLALTANGGKPVKHPRSYPRGPMNLYYQLGVVSDRLFGLRPPLFESVMFITANRVLDLTRAREELGFQPSVDVSTAVTRTVDWFRRENLLP